MIYRLKNKEKIDQNTNLLLNQNQNLQPRLKKRIWSDARVEDYNTNDIKRNENK